MEKAYLSESEMAATKDGRFYCFSFKPLKPSGCFMYHQVQHRTLCFAHILCSCVLFSAQQHSVEIFYTAFNGNPSRNLGITDINPCTPLSKVCLSQCTFL